MTWYSRRAGPILRERLEELRSANPSERHSLADEVDLARLIAERNVQIYEAAVLEGKGSDELKAEASAALRAALNHVSEIVSKAAKVHAVSNSVIELEHIDYIVVQMTRAIEEEIAEVDRALADRLIARLGSIKLPEGKESGAEDTAQAVRAALREIEGSMGDAD